MLKVDRQTRCRWNPKICRLLRILLMERWGSWVLNDKRHVVARDWRRRRRRRRQLRGDGQREVCALCLREALRRTPRDQGQWSGGGTIIDGRCPIAPNTGRSTIRTASASSFQDSATIATRWTGSRDEAAPTASDRGEWESSWHGGGVTPVGRDQKSSWQRWLWNVQRAITLAARVHMTWYLQYCRVDRPAFWLVLSRLKGQLSRNFNCVQTKKKSSSTLNFATSTFKSSFFIKPFKSQFSVFKLSLTN